MPTLPKQEEVQAKFDASRNEGLSPCLWIPPYWDKLVALDGGKRRGFLDNSFDEGEQYGISNKTGASDKGNERIKAGSAKNEPRKPESAANDKDWTSPFGDFTHVDDAEFPTNDLKEIEKAMKDKPEILGRLKRIVGAESPGMQRLGLIFEWALYRATELMKDLNDALDDWNPQVQDSGKAKFEEARKSYIGFLRDLDNHEPGKRDEKELKSKDKKFPSGYGRSLKWACIDPVIYNGRIAGTRVVIHWNPHSSSNGVPIPHNP
jgi:hypothetical protein